MPSVITTEWTRNHLPSVDWETSECPVRTNRTLEPKAAL